VTVTYDDPLTVGPDVLTFNVDNVTAYADSNCWTFVTTSCEREPNDDDWGVGDQLEYRWKPKKY
jgi:hypothetical protein